MSETGWAAFLGEHRAEETPAERASRLARQQAERAERRELTAEAERAVAAESEQERRLFAYQQIGYAGRSAAEVFADAGRSIDEDAEYEQAKATMAKIERHRAQRVEAMRWEAEQLEMAHRSAVPEDMLAPARRALTAAQRVDAMLRAPARPERRPKEVSRSGGAVVRSEHCEYCVKFGVTDEQSYLLHSDPEWAVPVAPRQAEQEEQARAVNPDLCRNCGYKFCECNVITGGRVPMIYR